MKKVYMKPTLERELYTLDMSIASNCAIVVSNGPAMDGHDQCSDYKDPFAIASYSSRVYNVQFYEDTNCDCYTTGSDTGYWMS